jgi:hypothetical protein
MRRQEATASSDLKADNSKLPMFAITTCVVHGIDKKMLEEAEARHAIGPSSPAAIFWFAIELPTSSVDAPHSLHIQF